MDLIPHQVLSAPCQMDTGPWVGPSLDPPCSCSPTQGCSPDPTETRGPLSGAPCGPHCPPQGPGSAGDRPVSSVQPRGCGSPFAAMARGCAGWGHRTLPLVCTHVCLCLHMCMCAHASVHMCACEVSSFNSRTALRLCRCKANSQAREVCLHPRDLCRAVPAGQTVQREAILPLSHQACPGTNVGWGGQGGQTGFAPPPREQMRSEAGSHWRKRRRPWSPLSRAVTKMMVILMLNKNRSAV